ncbi:Nuclear transcription factor Y subunit C-3 [Trifolium repens]|nr:Nuclear transcription factor Y subunit C-3 [Trifolium repens]
MPYGSNPYQSDQINGAPGTVVTSAGSMQSTGQPAGAQHQLAYQHIHQQLQQQLQSFWENQCQEIENVTDIKNHSLPLARIKKIMKADKDARMISGEAPVLFAKACEMFISELTMRSWNHTEEKKRRTLQKSDIAAAIARTDIFDFLVDIVPRDDEVLASIPRGTMSVGGPSDALPYCYMPPPSMLLIPSWHHKCGHSLQTSNHHLQITRCCFVDVKIAANCNVVGGVRL